MTLRMWVTLTYTQDHTHTHYSRSLSPLFLFWIVLMPICMTYLHNCTYCHTSTHIQTHICTYILPLDTWPLLQVIFIMRIYDVWKPQITEMPLHPTGIYSHHMQTSSYSWHFMHMSLVRLQFCHPTKPLIWTLQHRGLPAHPWNLKCILELSCCGT